MTESGKPRTAASSRWPGIIAVTAIVIAALALVVAWGRGAFSPNLDALTASEAGAYVLEAQGCRACHRVGDGFRAPTLEDAFGRIVELADGGTTVADEAYIRESLLEPRAKVVKGYQPVMPSYRGQLTDLDIARIVAFMKARAADSQ